jgi:hypothetical protein
VRQPYSQVPFYPKRGLRPLSAPNRRAKHRNGSSISDSQPPLAPALDRLAWRPLPGAPGPCDLGTKQADPARSRHIRAQSSANARAHPPWARPGGPTSPAEPGRRRLSTLSTLASALSAHSRATTGLSRPRNRSGCPLCARQISLPAMPGTKTAISERPISLVSARKCTPA